MENPILKKKNKSLFPVSYKMLTKDVSKITYDEGAKKVTGYLAVFGTKDDADDILIKGCFSKSLQERGPQSATNRKIAFLWMHDMKDPIGKFTTLKEDDYGLYFEAELDDFEAVPNAKRADAQLKSGTLNQFSIGYDYVWEDNKMVYDSTVDAFIIKEVVLWEGSVVTLGCNEYTYFTGMKSYEMHLEKNKLRDETEAIIKSVPSKYQYELRQVIAKNISFASLLTKDNTVADTDGTDATDNPLLNFLNDSISHCQAGIDMADDYDGNDDDLTDDVEDMKSMHADLQTKMLAHKDRLFKGEKALDPTKPGKKDSPLGKDKPPVPESRIGNIINSLQIS